MLTLEERDKKKSGLEYRKLIIKEKVKKNS
jgi:hypothetical protein